MKHLLYSFPLRSSQAIGHSLSLKCTPHYAYAACAVDNKTAQMTLRLQSSKLLWFFSFFFFGCLSGFGFWHTASIKAFEIAIECTPVGPNRQTERQTDMRAVIQSFTQSITQAVSQSFWQSVIQWRCVLYNKSEMCTARPETKLHSIKKSCRGAQININSMNINCHCCTLRLRVCVRARVCGAGDGRQMDRSTFTLAAMATGTAMMMIPTDCQLTHMPQKVTHTQTLTLA